MSPIVRDQIRQEVDLIEKCSTYYHRRLARLIDELNHASDRPLAAPRASQEQCMRLCVEAVDMLLANQNQLCRALRRLSDADAPAIRVAA